MPATLDTLRFCLVVAAILGSGLIAGTFFAFSSFVMPALARLEPTEGIKAMQSINRTVLVPSFLVPFMGMAVLGAGLGAEALWHPGEPGAFARGLGGALYVAGTFLVTIAGNVPLNDALERTDAASADGHALWARYLRRWTALNTLRTVAAAAATVAFALGLGPAVGGVATG